MLATTGSDILASVTVFHLFFSVDVENCMNQLVARLIKASLEETCGKAIAWRLRKELELPHHGFVGSPEMIRE